MKKNTTFLKKEAKRIIYTLAKRFNLKAFELNFTENDIDNHTTNNILTRLKKKGLIEVMVFPGGKDRYNLSELGVEVSKPIVKEIDEYKRW